MTKRGGPLSRIREILRFYLTSLTRVWAEKPAFRVGLDPLSPGVGRLWIKAKRARAQPIRFHGAWDTSFRAETSRRDAQEDPLPIRSARAKSQ